MIEGGAQVRGLCASCLAATLPVYSPRPPRIWCWISSVTSPRSLRLKGLIRLAAGCFITTPPLATLSLDVSTAERTTPKTARLKRINRKRVSSASRTVKAHLPTAAS